MTGRVSRGLSALGALLALFSVAFINFVHSQYILTSISVADGEWKCLNEQNEGNVRCSGNATTSATGRLHLTPDPPGRNESSSYFSNTVGMALHRNSVRIVDPASGRPASLSIKLTVLLEAGNGFAGDGMAFVIFPTSAQASVGNPGGSFGVYNEDGFYRLSTVAIEFDTYVNSGVDLINGDHVGIDTTSIASAAASRVNFDLSGEPVHAWIDYNASANVLEVRVSRISERPFSATVSHFINLAEALDAEEVSVGFAAANGLCSCFSYYAVLDLTVNSSSIPLPSPTPPTSPTPLASPAKSSESRTGLIAGVAVGIAGLLIGGCFFFFAISCRKRKKDDMNALSSALAPKSSSKGFRLEGLPPLLKVYTYEELTAATNNFSDDLKLGQGGYGSVYHGFMLGSYTGVQVAVKKVSSDAKQAERQFMAEVESISMLRHRHIVQLLGYCNEGQGKFLLVYEYMQNGSLDRHLFPSDMSEVSYTKPILPWKLRHKILGELAVALHYLHEGWRQQVLHRDVKCSNVMLDDNFNAMLGDFGLARRSEHYKNPITTGVAGTFGFIAPEVSMTGKYTAKSDVFAFGAVCLEVVCGCKAYDGKRLEEDVLLVNIVWRRLSENKLLWVVDQRLQGQYDEAEVQLVLLLGLMCSHPRPSERPTMHKVVEILAGNVELPNIPTTKPEPDEYTHPYTNRSKHGIPAESSFSDIRTKLASSSKSSGSHASVPSLEPSFEVR